MPKEFFIARNFGADSVAIIRQANAVITSYAAQGYDLSLRQLFYQFVSRNWLANSEQSYKRLGSIINDARMAGLIDWNAIQDRGRQTLRNVHWESPKEMLLARAETFQVNKWEDQPNHVEVMVEKQALEGVLVPVCSGLDVPFSANKGYASASFLYHEPVRRMRKAMDDGKHCNVLYLGDHDPSGLDMTRDVFARLGLLLGEIIDTDDPLDYTDGDGGYDIGTLAVRRLALNADQIAQYNPPPNPAKITDSRAAGYIARHGNTSWELDALNPTVLGDLVHDAVISLRDDDLWQAQVDRQSRMRDDLRRMANNYTDGAA